MEEEWECERDRELSQQGEVTSQDLGLQEEATVQEFYQQQEEVTVEEVSPCGVVRRQEWHQCEVGVRVQRGDGAQRELEMFHWGLSQWDKEDETHQELSQLEVEGYQELYPLKEDVQVHLHMHQGEGDQREPELSHVADNREKELTQAKDYNVQQLPQWEKDGSNQNLSQREESISSQGLSHWGESARYKIHDKPLHAEKDEDTQTCAQQGPGSPSSVGTQVAAEAAWELPSAPPDLGSPTEDELAAAAVPAGAAEQLEEPLEHLAPEVEKAPGSPAGSDELPSTGTESPVPAPLSPPGCSPALLGLGGHISSEVVLRAVPEAQASGQQPEEQEDLEQSVDAELEAAAPGQREQSLSSAPHSPCCPPSPSPSPLGAQALREQQEEAEWGSGLAEDESKEGALAGELEHSQCKDEEHTELSQGEMNKYQEGSQGEVCTEQELSLEEASSYQEGSQEKAYSEQELPQAESNRYQDKSQEEASTEKEVPQVESRTYQKGFPEEPCTEQEFPQEEATTYQEGSQGEASTEQEMSSAESGNHQEGSQGEASTEQEMSSAESGSHQEGSQGEASTEQELSSAESGSYQEGFQCCLHSIDQELFPEETCSYDEGPQGEACNEQELSLEEVGSYHELSSCDERVKKELSHGGDVGSYQEVSKGRIKVSKENQRQVGGSHNLSDWEEDSEHELFLGDVGGCQEVSDWEESIGQELSGGNGRRPSVESSWESDGDRDLVQDSWEERTRAKPLLQEDDDWDERSVIELREDEDRERIAAGLTGGRFFVPLPREAWVELGASGPCLGGPLCASSPHGEDLAPGGHAASPDFQEQVPKARRPPALRALRSLFCFPCLAPQPED